MTIVSLLYYIFIAATVLLAIYYIGFAWFFPSNKKKREKLNTNTAISVVICAKNEAENLRINLPKILNQDYKNFELVLVNDNSQDSTLEVMEEFKNKYKDIIRIVNVKFNEQFWGNKKYALTLGIKATKNDILVFTDADCFPKSNQWLNEISKNFDHTTELTLGFGAYSKIKYSLLNALIRYETLTTALQYFSYANAGIPYMGVGRNLAYKKELFFNNGGFMKHMSIKSGDDDLFVNSCATKHNIAVCITKNSFTISNPKRTYKEWIIQKRRHLSTSKHYKLKHKVLLALFYCCQVNFWILGIILLSLMFNPKFVCSLIAFKIIFQFSITANAAKKLDSKDLVLLTPFLELFLIAFQFLIFIANIISKPKHWK